MVFTNHNQTPVSNNTKPSGPSRLAHQPNRTRVPRKLLQNGREVRVKDGGRQGIEDHEGQFPNLAVVIVELVDDEGEGRRDAGGREREDRPLGLQREGKEMENDL